MRIRTKRILFCALLCCASILNLFSYGPQKLCGSILMVAVPLLFYFSLCLLVSQIGKKDEKSKAFAALSRTEKAGAAVSLFFVALFAVTAGGALFRP